MEQQPQQTASTPQIRSRITVVCAECKRLKLKCDRRSPCSSCTKRDTVARCIYSPAAAEKVDLHSLNNRLMQVEATLAQMTAGTFQSSYPPAQPQNAPIGPSSISSALTPSTSSTSPTRNISFPPNNHLHHHHPTAVATHVHDSPHPLALSLDELRSAWLDSMEFSRPGRTASGRPAHPIKLEISPVELEQQKRLRARPNSGTYPHSRHPNPQPYLPPVNVYYSATQPPKGSPATYNFSQSPPPPSIASITPAVLDLLPSTQTCMRIFARAKLVLSQRPIPMPGGWLRFELKAHRLLSRRPGSAYPNNGAEAGNASGEESEVEGSAAASKEKRRSDEGLTFFAILCAILAIGASVSPPDVFGADNVNAGFLYALSQQALSVWEMSAPSSRKNKRDKISFLVACLAGIGYLLLVTPDFSSDSEGSGEDQEVGDGKPRAIFPLVGKMVNVARDIGLGKEKASWQGNEDAGGSSGGPEARKQRQRAWEDVRRVIWWDVMFYDLFTSDALGHPSLISPLSYSAAIPELTDNTLDQSAKKYILARCRLVQLAQRVKHRLSHPDCCCGYTFDQAVALEDDIRRWSRECLSQDEDEKGEERLHNWELALTAQLLVLRAYVPFLTSATSAAAARKQANGTSGPIKAVGKTGLVEKPQIQGNAMATATQSCLGAAQAILRLGNKLHVSLSKELGSGTSAVGPVLMDFYPLERLVLDAVVITQSSTAVSVVNEAEVRRGLEILVEKEFVLGKERRDVWEAIKRRVLTSSKLQASQQNSQLNLKRKHDQVEIPGLASANEVAEVKKAETPTKHLKGSGGHPNIGVRFREGRMSSSGPVRAVDSRYEREREGSRTYGTAPTAQSTEVGTGQTMMQVNTSSHLGHQLSPHQPQPHAGAFVSSPTTFSPEQSLQGQSQHRVPLDRSMQQSQHQLSQIAQQRSSFDSNQSKAIYRFEDAAGPSALLDTYGNALNGGIPGQGSSASSSPYQSTTPPFSTSQFGTPENMAGRTPTSQLASDSPTIGFGGSDGQSVTNFANPPKFGPDARQAPPFENPRPTFATENPQPQAFDKLQQHSSTFDSNQSPTLTVSSSSFENHSHGSSPPTYGVSDGAHTASGYFHAAPSDSYDAGSMHQMGMSIDSSVPGTPIYEKPQPHQALYDKPHHQLLHHGGHALSVSAQHAMISNAFVGDPPHTQGLVMTGGPQPPHHASHQPWTSTQHPQPLVSVPGGQPFWC